MKFEGDYCLVSIGRKPYTEGLQLDTVGVQLNERGQVEVNDHLQTVVPNIYAIGDVVGALLAHKAEEGSVGCRAIVGNSPILIIISFPT